MVISRDTFDPANAYRRIRFHEDRQLLDSELNELQDIQDQERSKLADQIFGEGAIVQGCGVVVGGAENHVLTIDPGQIYISGHIEPVAAVELTFDPAKTTGEDYVYAELLKTTIGVGEDAALINPRTLEPTAERERWSLTLQSSDNSSDPLPTGATARAVIPVLVFDRAALTVQPIVSRSTVKIDHLADAQIASAEDGQLLRFDGTTQRWRNTGLPTLTELADVEVPAPTDRQLLRFDETSGRWIHSDENSDSDTVDGIHASATPVANRLLPLNANAKFPPSVIEGSVAGADNADTVDGFHASAMPTANRLLPLNASAKILGTVISGQVPDSAHSDLADQASQANNADTVDNIHASATPTANKLLPLDASAKIPGTVISGQVPDAAHANSADQATDASHADNADNADTVDGIHVSATPTANSLLPLNASAKIPSSVIEGSVASAVNADTIDGYHASLTPGANRILPLDSSTTLNLGGQSLRNVGKLQVGSSTLYNYNRIGAGTTNHGLSTANDLLISAQMEVNGSTYLDGAVTTAGNLTVGGNLTGYRCLLTCGHIAANTLTGGSGYYRNLESPFGLPHDTAHGMYMPRAGSVTGLAGRFDLVSQSAGSNLKLEIISFPIWAVQSIDLPDTVQNNIVIGPLTWTRGVIPFGAGDHIWLRLHQAGPAGSQGQIRNVECVVEVTFD